MWLLMPSVLLFRQISYRTLSRAESRDPPLESSCLVRLWVVARAPQLVVGPYSSLTRPRVFSWK